MELWGCRLGLEFLSCAQTQYSLPQRLIVAAVAIAAVTALVYYGGRWLIRVLGL
jgi:hypothetical protein